MPRMTVTERKLTAMLTENTGSHFLDSGSAYGRNWQRNQKRNFRSEPITTLAKVGSYLSDGDAFEPEVTHHVFGWLNERLEFDSKMNRKYQTFARSRRANDYELSIMEEFTEYLSDFGEVAGMCGDGDPMTVNTYNNSDLLSQVLQYRYFSFDNTPYVLLQIHGGCDVRGGYTDAVVFREDVDLGMFSNADASISDGDNYWQTDDAYHWYADGACGGVVQESDCDGPFPTKRSALCSFGMIGKENMRKHRAGLYKSHRYARDYWIGTRAELEKDGWSLPA